MPQTHAAVSHAENPDVIVIGEALVDVVTTSKGTIEHPGGSPANVAYGLGRLEVSTALLTSIGDDERGAAIERHLSTAGVALLPGSRTQGRTASATATLAADGSAHYDFDIAWDLKPVTPAYLPKVLHTGSIASFLAPGAAVVKGLLEQAHRECLVTYDPNIRPALLGSHAEALAIFEELVPLTDVVKLSDEDAQWLYPGQQPKEAAARILGLGAGLAVITLGSEGSLLATPATQLHVPSVRTTVADTIGAGDSYMAALIYGLLCRSTDGLAPSVLETLGRTASKAAAITVSRPGANPPTVEELTAEFAAQLPVVERVPTAASVPTAVASPELLSAPPGS
ncbi:carbohydrate kinase [Arthrobacter sp. ISL-30]|uniref:carbohydrate kinase family protein n=1 Tax=Arthrobacter sp. ISL-30 TaxID=2819109 RepID=UPI001BEB6083|nr:carbohydrate kinase [Arthrobacter sp. ISL-30]MBT2512441.1 carbohydrate kinase [Arthrobacter sp. ISL-30]